MSNYAEIFLKRGDKETLNLTFVDNTDENNPIPYDLTGATVFFTVKYIWDDSNDDENAVIKAEQATHDDAAGGITTIELSTTDTNIDIGEYKADFQIVDSGGDPSSSEEFRVIISNDITKRTS